MVNLFFCFVDLYSIITACDCLKQTLVSLIFWFNGISTLDGYLMLNPVYIFHHHQVTQLAWISLTFSCHLSLSLITLSRSSRLHPVSVQSCCKLLLVGQNYHINMKGSIGECHLWVHPYFSSSVSHVIFILFGWY